jgi:DNA polymerase-3 subunit delta
MSKPDDFSTIIGAIKKREFAPIYLLMGDEPFFIDRITAMLEKTVMPEEERSFNQVILYGRDTTIDQVLGEAKQYPMMSENRLVIVKEAQALSVFGRASKDEEGESATESKETGSAQLLQSYCEKPLSSTILVFAIKGKSVRKDSKIVKAAVANKGVYFKSEQLRDYEVPKWLKQVVAAKKMTINDQSAQLMVDHLGADLGRIFMEIEKLHVILGANGQITEKEIEKHVGVNREFNVFELTKALNANDKKKAYIIVNYFANNSKNYPIQMILPSLYGNYTKLLKLSRMANPGRDEVARELKIPPFIAQEYMSAKRFYDTRRVMHAFELLREYDLRSKGVNNGSTEGGELLREFVLRV